MRFLLSVLILLAMAALGAAPANADESQPGPGLVEYTEWVKWGDLSSLRVYPTQAARAESAKIGTMSEAEAAWKQVLASAPDADIPGMRDQFLCHWQFAEIAQPGKTSWNLEPWRPVVDPATMVETGCNPGGTEEPF